MGKHERTHEQKGLNEKMMNFRKKKKTTKKTTKKKKKKIAAVEKD